MLRHYLAHPTVRRLLTATCILAVIAHAIIVVGIRPAHFRDFDLHRLIGTWFLTHQDLYGCGICYPYMPIGAMYFSLLALVSRTVAFALRYTAAITCLWLTCVLFHRMIRDRFPDVANATLLLSIIAVLLATQFILYDLDDGGPHVILMGMMVGGMYAVWTGREKFGAIWLGLAIALKVTPGLFLPFFLWKRQWRLALYTTVATLCWIVLPMLWMGPTSWWNHQLTWTRVAVGSALGMETQYTRINEDNIRNSGISPALMRYLVTLAPEHPLRQNDPGYTPVFDLPPAHARVLVAGAVLSLLGIFGKYTRRPYGGPGDSQWPEECSMVLILMLLLSPLTWIQHLPWLVPALYWIAAKACSHGGLNPLSKAALGLYVVITIVLNYELLGKHNFTVFLSFKPFTLAMVLILAIVMGQRKDSDRLAEFSMVPLVNAK